MPAKGRFESIALLKPAMAARPALHLMHEASARKYAPWACFSNSTTSRRDALNTA
jgi:hypothetical protein